MGRSILNHLCLGAKIDGIRFGGILQLLITNHETNEYEKGIKGQIYINLASKWMIFESMPERFPRNEDEMKELTQDEEISIICSLREKKIVDIRLGDTIPHLIITLEFGQVFFLNGHNEKYECWDIGVAFNPVEDNWMVVAGSHDDLVIGYPSYFE